MTVQQQVTIQDDTCSKTVKKLVTGKKQAKILQTSIGRPDYIFVAVLATDMFSKLATSAPIELVEILAGLDGLNTRK